MDVRDPDAADDDAGDDEEAQRQEEAFQRQYDNEHTWEALQEDEHGMLRVDRSAEQRAKRLKTLSSAAQSARIRKGMIRYVLLVLDVSAGAGAQDLRPNRLACMLRVTRDFIRRFFDQNPLSQLGLLLMRNGCCERLTELSGSPESQIRRLEAAQLGAEGAASLQNALDMSVASLRNIPPYGHREVLILFAALSTCDPGSIFDSIKAAKEAKVRVSVVGVAAEVYVCRRMAEDTGGTYGVALHEIHLDELLSAHAPPPPAPVGRAGAELVCMGFPQRGPESSSAAVFVGAEARLTSGSYLCPRCAGRVGELPGECHVCRLTLISSPHLARSYHHLFPVEPFQELSQQQVQQLCTTPSGEGMGGGSQGEVPGQVSCFGCLQDLTPGSKLDRVGGLAMVLSCPTCCAVFCFECDAYVHESLHNCPGCQALGQRGPLDGV
ncbi:Ssl1-like-domain-containing protein [Haematococcus lacustris]